MEEIQKVETDINQIPQFISNHLPDITQFCIRVVIAAVVFGVGMKLIQWLLKVVRRSLGKSRIDEGVAQFTCSMLKVLLYALLIFNIATYFGVKESSVAALLGTAGVTIGLALQGGLANVAGGVMILFFQPFVIGDFVRYNDVSGTIEEITLRHTVIRTPQNKRIIIPNGTINGSVLENANYGDSRICEFFNVSITYESDMEKAIDILRDEVIRNPLHLDVRTPETASTEPEVKVEVVELADSAIIIRAWLWAENQTNAMELKFALNRSVKKRFDAEGIEFAYPHLTIVK